MDQRLVGEDTLVSDDRIHDTARIDVGVGVDVGVFVGGISAERFAEIPAGKAAGAENGASALSPPTTDRPAPSATSSPAPMARS
ncbi:hypothetical protein ACH4MG_28205 [Streptomyces sp. NPDC017454]|uniref:hypothetical protein n=1 Tax=Streptomyces sp. NPDC017454 TaxID=3364997 RepID=UPI0037944ECE